MYLSNPVESGTFCFATKDKIIITITARTLIDVVCIYKDEDICRHL